MDIRQLRYFVRVVQAKSFTKASESLRIAQPALGHQVRKLEDELGVQLLVRHSRGVSPTEAGLKLQGHAEVLLRQLERAKQDLVDFSGPPKGNISLGMTPTTSLVLAAPLVERCRSELPGVSVSIAEGLSETLMEWVADDRLDLAFTYNPHAVKGLSCEPLLTEDLFFVGPGTGEGKAGGDIRFADIGDLPLIVPSRPHRLRTMIDAAAEARGHRLNVDFEIDSVPAIKELVQESLGYSILPLGAVKREVGAGSLSARRITEPSISRTLHLASAEKRPPSKAITALRELIRALIRDSIETEALSWRAAR